MTVDIDDGRRGRIGKWWARQSLARQYAMAGTCVVALAMAILGWWIAQRITESVIQNTGLATALYVNSFVGPALQELGERDRLSRGNRLKLRAAFKDTELGKRVLSFKVWKPGGRIVYALHSELIGRTFPESAELERAWSGNVSAELSSLDADESKLEREFSTPLIEIYSPVRAQKSDHIIAVAEFYAIAENLEHDTYNAKLESWLLILSLALTTIALLFGIVRRGSKTIDSQRRDLEQRVGTLSSLLSQNESLRKNVEEAAERSVQINERFLRRVGSELHDGPAQLLGLALLRLGKLAPCERGGDMHLAGRKHAYETIQDALSRSLEEIRNVSTGLALPELEQLSVEDALSIAVSNHEKRTQSVVQTDISPLPATAPHRLKVCLFRFVQEGLNNAYQHAGGNGQYVRARCADGVISVEVADNGPGFSEPDVVSRHTHLGLRGLRERIETLGGSFSMVSSPDSGTTLSATLRTDVTEAHV